MTMEASVVTKIDDDFILDGLETSEEGGDRGSATSEELMAIIDQLRAENAALLRANTELIQQSRPSGLGTAQPSSRKCAELDDVNMNADVSQKCRRILEVLRKQAQDMKEIRELAEDRTQSTISYITDLEQQVGDLSLQLLHKDKADNEIRTIKQRLKKLESLALEYVPLGRQTVLMEIEECKTEILAFQKRQKQRQKKEEFRRKGFRDHGRA